MDQELYDKLVGHADKLIDPNCRLVTWTMQENDHFILLAKEHGKDWKTISDKLGTKEPSKCKHKGYNLFAAMKKGKVPMNQQLYDMLDPQNSRSHKTSSLITWTKHEQDNFILLAKEFGKNWRAISE